MAQTEAIPFAVVSSETARAVKYRRQLSDGKLIETAYVDYRDKHIICFSSQIGCPLACRHCIVGQKEFVRNLTAAEMISQCMSVFEIENLYKSDKPVLFSAMGSGEPLLNISEVSKALWKLSRTGRTALSTILPSLAAIYGLNYAAPPISKLQVSIHGGNDLIRQRIVGPGGSVSIAEKVRAIKEVAGAHRWPVDWNYVVVLGVNDRADHAEALADLLDSRDHIKLNRFNSITISGGTPTLLPGDRERFAGMLHTLGFPLVELYDTNGSDIGAACGQLTYQIEVS